MMEAALVVLALTGLVFAALVVRAVRSVRRGVARVRGEVRRTLADAALTARAAQPGLVGDVARVRREVRASVEGTRLTLSQAAERDGALGEALALFGQLEGHARELDGQLAALTAGEPDRDRIAERLPELRERAARIRRSADALRFAAQDRARRHDAEELDALHRRIDLEAGALRHWTPAADPGVEPGPAVSPPSSPPLEDGPGERPGRRPRRLR
jgi:hypothetical protein